MPALDYNAAAAAAIDAAVDMERDRLVYEEGWSLCSSCDGTGTRNTPSDPVCPTCDGIGATPV